jgi:predicted RNA-binding protein with EMAP domain
MKRIKKMKEVTPEKDQESKNELQTIIKEIENNLQIIKSVELDCKNVFLLECLKEAKSNINDAVSALDDSSIFI